jgi:lysophospholipase
VFPGVYDFPPVPQSTAEFVAKELTTKPTFFGCDTSPTSPLIIYLANGGPPRNGGPPLTNTSTEQLAYQDEQIRGMLDQTFDIALQGDGGEGGSGIDKEWPACLACAVVDKARGRLLEERSGICQRCFDRYCYQSGDGMNDVERNLLATWGIVSASHNVNYPVVAGSILAGLGAVGLLWLGWLFAVKHFTTRRYSALPSHQY